MMYNIFKDGELFGETSSRSEAIEAIRQAQAMEDHYLLRANFSIIKGDRVTITEAALLPVCKRYHIIENGTLIGSTATLETARLMIQQSLNQNASAVFYIIGGDEEFIHYPKGNRIKRT